MTTSPCKCSGSPCRGCSNKPTYIHGGPIYIDGPIHNEELDGRKFFVVPVTMIVPGVLQGSKGALMYEPHDIAANVHDWDGVPLTHNHPFHPTTGEPLSARNPDVKARQHIGHIGSPHVTQDGRLRAKAYFDVERVRRICPQVLSDLRAGKKIEVSTGLFTTNVPAPSGSRFNGTPFTHYARNYRPDHLAVLVGGRGACSVRDGCGLNVNAFPYAKELERTMVMVNNGLYPDDEDVDFSPHAFEVGDPVSFSTASGAEYSGVISNMAQDDSGLPQAEVQVHNFDELLREQGMDAEGHPPFIWVGTPQLTLAHNGRYGDQFDVGDHVKWTTKSGQVLRGTISDIDYEDYTAEVQVEGRTAPITVDLAKLQPSSGDGSETLNEDSDMLHIQTTNDNTPDDEQYSLAYTSQEIAEIEAGKVRRQPGQLYTMNSVLLGEDPLEVHSISDLVEEQDAKYKRDGKNAKKALAATDAAIRDAENLRRLGMFPDPDDNPDNDLLLLPGEDE